MSGLLLLLLLYIYGIYWTAMWHWMHYAMRDVKDIDDDGNNKGHMIYSYMPYRVLYH